MRRVFAVIGFTFLITTLVSLIAGGLFQIVIICVCSAAFLISMLIRPLRQSKIVPVVAACIILATANCLVRTETDIKPAAKMYGQTASITATSVDLPAAYDGYVKYVFRADEINGKKANLKFIAFFSEDIGVEPYGQIAAKAKFYKNDDSMYFDFGKGIYARASLSEFEVLKPEKAAKPLNYYMLMFRNYAIETINKFVGGQNAALTNAIVFSEKSGLSDEIYSSFKSCGMLHATAVSGMHVAILVSSLFFLFSGLHLNRKWAAAICIVLTILYMALTGFMFSVVRAGIMVIIMLVGILISKRPDALNSLGFAGLLIVLTNPFSAVNTSFLLSFCATLGMVVMFVPISALMAKTKLNNVAVSIITPFLQSICANIFILPLMYFFFGSVSVISPIANMLLMFSISGILNFGLITIALSWVPPLAMFSGFITKLLSDYCINVSAWLASFRFSIISVDYTFFGIWMAAVMLLFAVIAALIARGKVNGNAHAVRVGAYISVIMLVCAVFANFLVMKDVTAVTLLNSGNSYTAVIMRGSNAVVVGTGGEQADYSYKSFDDRVKIGKVELMIVPSLNIAYSQKAKNVVKWSKPEKVVVDNTNDRYYQIEAVAQKGSITALKNSTITVWNDVIITPYYLPSSVALYVKIGSTKLLFADGEASLKLLPDEIRNTDVTIISGSITKQDQIKSPYTVECSSQSGGSVSTADGNIQILTRGKNDITMKRMR